MPQPVPNDVLDRAGDAIAKRNIVLFLDIFAREIHPAFMSGYQKAMADKGIHPDTSAEKLALVQALLQLIFILESILLITHGMNYVQLIHAASKTQLDERIRTRVGWASVATNTAAFFTRGATDHLVLRFIKFMIKRHLGTAVAEHLDIEMLTYMISNVGKIVNTYPKIISHTHLTSRDVTSLSPPLYVLIGLTLLAVDESHIRDALHRFKTFIDKNVLNLSSSENTHKPSSKNKKETKQRVRMAPDVKEPTTQNNRRRTASSPVTTKKRKPKNTQPEFHSISPVAPGVVEAHPLSNSMLLSASASRTK